MFSTTIAGSLPKPGWLAETHKLWPKWRSEGDELRQAKADATLLWIKAQEDAGLDIVTDGEQSRQHFVHGFLENIEGIAAIPDWERAFYGSEFTHQTGVKKLLAAKRGYFQTLEALKGGHQRFPTESLQPAGETLAEFIQRNRGEGVSCTN